MQSLLRILLWQKNILLAQQKAQTTKKIRNFELQKSHKISSSAKGTLMWQNFFLVENIAYMYVNVVLKGQLPLWGRELLLLTNVLKPNFVKIKFFAFFS